MLHTFSGSRSIYDFTFSSFRVFWSPTLAASSLKHEKMRPTNPLSNIWYMPWVRTSGTTTARHLSAHHHLTVPLHVPRPHPPSPTCDGNTVMCGWEWYQPITRVRRPEETVSLCGSVKEGQVAGRQRERESYRRLCVCVSLCAHVCTENMYLCIRLCARRQWYDTVMIVFSRPYPVHIYTSYIHMYVYTYTSVNAGIDVQSHTGTNMYVVHYHTPTS